MRFVQLFVASLVWMPSLLAAQTQYAGPYPPVPARYESFAHAATAFESIDRGIAERVYAAGYYDYMASLACEHYQQARAQCIKTDQEVFEARVKRADAIRAREASGRAERQARREHAVRQRSAEAEKALLTYQADRGHFCWPKAIRSAGLESQALAVEASLDDWLAMGRPARGVARQSLLRATREMRESLTRSQLDSTSRSETFGLLSTIGCLLQTSSSVATTVASKD